jgi:PHD/YefM family antitoxin component YafN of YafNO toxin-antitoxin module
MPHTVVTSREYNQNRSAADKALRDGPVVITHRGRPAKVLMSYREYERLKGRELHGEKKKSLLELLTMPGLEDIDFDPPRIGNELLRIPDFED